MCFVGVTEVGQVFPIGNIVFTDDHRFRGVVFDQGAKQLDDLVGLLQMDTVCADFLPQIGNCIHSKNSNAVIEVFANDAHKLD